MKDIVTEATTVVGPMPKYFLPPVGEHGKIFGLATDRPRLPCDRLPVTSRIFAVFVDDPENPQPDSIHHLHTFHCN